MVPLHGDALHGGGSIVRCTEDAPDAGIFADDRSRLAEPREQALRQPEGSEDVRVKLSGLCIDQTGGGGIGKLLGFHTAELPEQVFRQHEKIRCAIQASVQLVAIELIDAGKGLELAAGAVVQLGKGQNPMHLRNDRLCAVVAVGVDRAHLFLAAQQHIVHAPGVDGKADNRRVFLLSSGDAALHMFQQRVNIPQQVAVLLLHAIGETVDLVGSGFAALAPADDMASGGRTDVNGQIILHKHSPLLLLLPFYAPHQYSTGFRGGQHRKRQRRAVFLPCGKLYPTESNTPCRIFAVLQGVLFTHLHPI